MVAMRVIRAMMGFILTIGDAIVPGLDLIGSGETGVYYRQARCY
jgi:hypothetical protein